MKQVAIALIIVVAFASPGAEPDFLAWPVQTRESRPWAYNWWPGNAVDRDNIAREMKRYREAGLGGIHIVPIYGPKGAENRYISYLSPKWMEMLQFAIEEGKRLDLGVDMTTGTGWCFGGPNIPEEQAGMTATFNLKAEKPEDAIRTKSTRMRVKRPSPGGEGYMINPFYGKAMETFLGRFTGAFDGYTGPLPRAMYHDSYEYVSRWSPDLLSEFEKRRGYRLQDRLADFAAEKPTDTTVRLRHDFQETLSDMMVENVFPKWVEWCHARKMITRNEAHGAPGNILDLYALADIPETEMFGRGDRDPLVSRFDEDFAAGDRDPFISKFASSAAHVAGRELVASETCTWMAEHFCETLEETKCFVDRMFVSGINHIFYHGTCYSPDDAAWPGWVFYASTEMNPRNSIWRDAPALNAYIARCQSILQSGRPDNDLLVYWPIHDLWSTPQRKPGDPTEIIQCVVHNKEWLTRQPIHGTAEQLWTGGWGFDYISDRQIAQTKSWPMGSYRALVVPPTAYLLLATLKGMMALAEQGGSVIFQERLPQDVPGLTDLEKQRAEFKAALARLDLRPVGQVRVASVGKGKVVVGGLEAALAHLGIQSESVTSHPGILFIRRTHETGRHYFIANQGAKTMEGWYALAAPARSVLIMDALTGRVGGAATRNAAGRTEVQLHLDPGHSIVLRTFTDRAVVSEAWRWPVAADPVAEIPGPWNVRFIEGGPALPKEYRADKLESWTRSGDPEAERFAGAAVYERVFDAPGAGPWVLDLGRVCHSARVRINGQPVGTLLMNPYRMVVRDLKPTGNRLEVEVTNLSANRIRDLDRRKVQWRIFSDINVVNIRYKPFDASEWPVFDSGLIGPVRLHSMQPAK